MSDCDGCSDRGQCCRYVDLIMPWPLDSDERRWLELHGLVMAGGRTIHIAAPCSALSHDGRCLIYEQRPKLCQDWPQEPEREAPPGCVYRKQEVTV